MNWNTLDDDEEEPPPEGDNEEFELPPLKKLPIGGERGA
jgi:hypothetical protein